jgi:hypothetical protein
MNKSLVKAMILLVVGTAAMAGDVLGIPELYALGLATHASPAPKVFTERDGLEGFSADFTLSWHDVHGSHSMLLTPDHYKTMNGPYNRRNVYGAALAGGPFLATHPQLSDLHAEVARYAFCEAGLLEELGATTSDPTWVRLEVLPRPGTHTDLPLTLELRC